MPLSWVAALKKYNEGKGKWCIPKKGSEDYDAVRKIMAGGSVPRSRSSSPAPASKKKLTAAEKEAARTKMGAPCADDRLSQSQKVAVRAKMFGLLTKEQRKDVKDFIKERFGGTKFVSIPEAQKMAVRVFAFRKLTKEQKAELREFKEGLLTKEGEALEKLTD